MRKIFKSIFFLTAITLTLGSAYAVQESTPLAADKRIKIFVYHPDEVYTYTGYYKFAGFIEFSPDEKVSSISIGDATGWQIKEAGSRIFLKPIDPEATTNMTVLTDKRIYHFELHAEEVVSINDDRLSFMTKFQYPDDEGYNSTLRYYDEASTAPDLTNPEVVEKFNFNYTITGNMKISPLKVFDDGEFTYMEFRNKNADIPAIFVVDEKGHESLINYRINGPYIVIERAGQMFTLRHGPDEVACIFNETNPLIQKREREPWLGIF